MIRRNETYASSSATIAGNCQADGRRRGPITIIWYRLKSNRNVVVRGFPHRRSSTVGSQHRKRLQLPIREAQLRLQQLCPFFDLVEGIPGEGSASPAATAQHAAPVTLLGPINLYETPEISGDAVIGIVTAQDDVDFTGLITDLIMPYLTLI
jgi:hypothetical protein